MSNDFPDDLIQLQRDLHATTADLKQFLDQHPDPPEPTDGWRDRQRDASPGWSDDDKARETELRRRLLDLIEQVHGHPHWDTLSGPDLVKARMKLKHVDEADTDG